MDMDGRRRSVVWLAALALSGVPVVTEAEEKAPEPPSSMTRHYLVLLSKGPAWTAEDTPETRRVGEGHMANIRKMAQAGTLALAGPLEDGGDLRGIFILRADSLEAARALASEDPGVKAGRFVVNVYTLWLDSKALPPRP
jgi:uncharacterized protein YciI